MIKARANILQRQRSRGELRLGNDQAANLTSQSTIKKKFKKTMKNKDALPGFSILSGFFKSAWTMYASGIGVGGVVISLRRILLGWDKSFLFFFFSCLLPIELNLI